MARHRITAKGLAISAGLSPSYVTKRLRDEAPFTLNDIEAICAALGEDIQAVLQAATDSIR
jgi:transcriptional regulator with XRE-family HTH domain